MTKLSVDQALIKARSHKKRGEIVEAQRLFEAVLKSFPKNKRAQKGLADLYRSRQDNKDKAPPEKITRFILDLYNNGQFSTVLKETQALAPKYPNVFLIWNLMGVAAAQLGLLDKAVVAFQKAIDLNPGSAEAYNNMGNIRIEQDRLDDAIEAYKKALLIKSDYAEAYYNMGNAPQDQGELGKAIDAYKKALSIKSDYAEAFYNIGNVLQDQGNLADAIDSYNEALLINPSYLSALNNLGNAFKVQGRPEKAKESYYKALEIDPKHAEAHYNLGNIFKDQNNLEDAIVAYKKALSVKPDYQNAMYMLSSLIGNAPASAPREYVESLFDGYAEEFEKSLVSNLEYKAPKLIKDLLLEVNSDQFFGSVLDLGCGTGLLGSEIKNYCSNLEGIDVSDKMLEIAKAKGVYDKLHQADIVEWLYTTQLSFDYFIAADVFVYIGDLSKIFQFIKSRNKKPGKLVFSTEHTQRDGYYLQKTGRYAHSKSYIKSLCRKFGYEISYFSTFDLRKENGAFITGGIYLLQHNDNFKTQELGQTVKVNDLAIKDLLERGISSHKSCNVEKAYNYFRAVLELDPKHPEANYSLGLLEIEFGNLNKSLLFFNTALEARPDFEQFWIRYIDTLLTLGKFPEAKSALDQAKGNMFASDQISGLSSKLSTSLDGSITKFYKNLSTEIIGVAAMGWLYDITIDREFFRPVIECKKLPDHNERVIDTAQNQTEKIHLSCKIDKLIDELNSINNTKERFQKLKTINSSNNTALFCDDFLELENMDFAKAQGSVFANQGLNILILGAGPCGLFLANALKKKLAEKVNVLVLDTNCQQNNVRKSFSRGWLSHLPLKLFEQYFKNSTKQLAGSFGKNGYIGLPINLIEFLLFLSAKQHDVKFYFSGSPDYSLINSKLIDLAFDASGGRICYDSQITNRKSKFSKKIKSEPLNFDFAGVKQLTSQSLGLDGTIPITLEEVGRFHYPHFGGSQLYLNSIKITEIPVSLHPSLINFINRNNKINRFYLWGGDLSDELNELLVIANLFQEEYEYLSTKVIIKEKLNEDFILEARKSQKIKEDLLDFLILLVSKGYGSNIYVDKPFIHQPRVNLFPLEQKLGDIKIYPIGDSLFSGNPKVGNGLGTHIRYISDLVETVF